MSFYNPNKPDIVSREPATTVGMFYESMHTFLKCVQISPSGIITPATHCKLQKSSLQTCSVIALTFCSSPSQFALKEKKRAKQINGLLVKIRRQVKYHNQQLPQK